MRADDGGSRFRLRIEDGADRAHGGNGGLWLAIGQSVEPGGDLGVGATTEFLELGSSLVGDSDDLAALVGRIRRRLDEVFGAEALENAAEIGGGELQVASERAGTHAVMRADLEEHARIRQREGRVEIGLVQKAKEVRVEAVEFAGGFDEGKIGHGRVS